MTKFFEKKDYWGNSLALWVLVGMVFVLPLACWSLTHIDLENDVHKWLPQNDPSSKTLKWYSQLFGDDAQILMAWEGSSLQDPRVRQLATRLKGVVGEDGVRRFGLKEVKDVIIPQDVLSRMIDYNVPPEEAIHRLEGTLIGSGLIKVRLTEEGRARKEKVVQLLQERARHHLQLDIEIVPAFAEWEDTSFSEDELATQEGGDESDSADAHEDVNADAAVLAQGRSTPGDDGADDSASDDAASEGPDAVADEEEAVVPSLAIPDHDFQIRWTGIRPVSPEVDSFKKLAVDLRLDRNPNQKSDLSLIDDCFFAPGTPVAVIITLSEAGNAESAIAIKKILAVAEEVGIPADDIHIGGRPVTTATLNGAVKTVSWNPAAKWWNLPARSGLLTAILVSALLAFGTLKNARLATYVLVVSIYATVLAVSFVPATGGSMNMVLVVMPILLLVITLSGSIHLVNYWQHAAQNNAASAVGEAVRVARLPVVLASVTTAIGLISLSTSSLVPVRDFGIYSAIGCLISLVVILYGLPSILLFWPAKVHAEQDLRRNGWRSIGGMILKYRWAAFILCGAGFVTGIYSLQWFRTETKVIRYFANHTRIVKDYWFLEENLSGITPLDIVIRFDKDFQNKTTILERMEIVRKAEAQVNSHPEISGTLSLADFRPVAEIPPADASFIKQAQYRKRAQITETKIKEAMANEGTTFYAVSETAVDLDQDGSADLVSAGDELWRITAQSSVMSDAVYSDLTAQVDEKVQSVLKYHPGSHHLITGTIPLFLRTQQAVLESLIVSFGLAFAVIAVIMMVFLKNPVSGLIAMFPNLLPVATVFGLISFLGIAVDTGTMITASVALGIAVDGTLHLLSWFRNGIMKGMTRREAIVEGVAHCAPAMCQTSLIIALGLLVLFPSDLLLISRFAWVTAALVAGALIADLILLPALLAGRLGMMIEKNICGVPDTVPLSSAVGKPATTGKTMQPHVMKLSARSSKSKMG
ncbi:MAG: MMPL family transporter [Planctomycetaceae bacterium]